MRVRAKPKTMSEKLSMRVVERPRRRKPCLSRWLWGRLRGGHCGDSVRERGFGGLVELDGADETGGEGEERADELEYAAYYEADETEGEQDEPDDGEEHEREQSGGPADDEEDDEEEKLHGWWLPFFDYYADGEQMVPRCRVLASEAQFVAYVIGSEAEAGRKDGGVVVGVEVGEGDLLACAEGDG